MENTVICCMMVKICFSLLIHVDHVIIESRYAEKLASSVTSQVFKGLGGKRKGNMYNFYFYFVIL